MFNPCVEHCFKLYGKQYSAECDNLCAYAKTVSEMNQLKSEMKNTSDLISDLAVYFCESIECSDCPVHTEDADTRTDKDRKIGERPCCLNLRNWIANRLGCK